jgi:hypothetical protein
MGLQNKKNFSNPEEFNHPAFHFPATIAPAPMYVNLATHLLSCVTHTAGK